MSQWEKARSNYKRLEAICIGIGIMCIIIGIACDILVANDIVFWVVDSLPDFSLVLLQIQATIGTLTIAIIALISGNISDSYMGTSVSDYYLNIRPKFLKQKVIIFVSLALILINAICYMMALYNIVIFVFVLTFFLVGMSIIEVYYIFNGKRKMHEEIEMYFIHVIENDDSYQKKVNICDSFVDDWKEISKIQNDEEVDKYIKLFIKGMKSLIECNDKQGYDDINKLSYKISVNLLAGISENEKVHGIIFVQEFYHSLWMYIMQDKSRRYENFSRITLFGSVACDFVDAMNYISNEKLEKVISLDSFVDNVLRVTYWIGYDAEKSSYEIGCLNSFARHIGFYLAMQNKKGAIVNKNFWGNTLKRCNYFYSANMQKNLIEDYAYKSGTIQFDFCYGFLMNNEAEIVKENLYYYSLSNTYRIENRQYAVLVLSTHCFLYYLGYRETEDCVDTSIKMQAQRILGDAKVKEVFLRFLYMLSENQEFINKKLALDILKILDRHELFPKYSNSKTMIGDTVVKDFYLFIILYLAHKYYIPEIVEKALDIDEYTSYVYLTNSEHTKKILRELHVLIDKENNEDVIEGEVNLMYDIFERKIKIGYKKKVIEKAAVAQKTYEEHVDVRSMCKKLKMHTIEKFKNKFSSIISDGNSDNSIIEIKAFTLSDYTEQVNGELYQGVYSNLFGNFVLYLIWYLNNNGMVNLMNRYDDFANDRAYMRYLQDNGLSILIGSKYILSNRDYKLREEFNDFLNDYDCIYTSLVADGLALRKDSIEVYLHDVQVSIRPGTINDMNIKFNKETGKYEYEVISNLPVEFDKEEIKEFIYNERKIIEIVLKVSINTNDIPIGTIISGNRN